MSFSDSDLRFLWFQCGPARFSVPLHHLREVIPVSNLRRLPMTESSLSGFIDLRSQIIPIFNPLALVSSGAPEVALPAIVIVLTLHEQDAIGLLAEKIGKMVQSPMPKPLPTPARIPNSFLGKTVLEDGDDSLVVDVFGLARTFGLTPVISQSLSPQQPVELSNVT